MRKPALVKVNEKILKSLPLLGDAELSHIASVCDGLLRLRAQAKKQVLMGQAQNPHTIGGHAGDEVVSLDYRSGTSPSK